MSDTYDPYFKWLGIPKADQPPHAYRLLGIELFESDADVISNAADGRMAQIKSFQTGKFAAVSQKLLNELAGAKICLLNPQKKVEYDRRLRAHLQEKNAAASARAQQPKTSELAFIAEDGIAGLPLSDYSTARSAIRPAKKKSLPAWVIPAGVGGATIAIVAGIAIYMSLAGDGGGKPPSSQVASLAAGDRESSLKQSGKLSDKLPAERVPKPAAAVPAVPAEKTGSSVSPTSTVPPPVSTPKPETASLPKTETAEEPKKTAPVEETPKKEVEKGPEKPADNTVVALAPSTEKDSEKKPPVPDKEQWQAMKGKIVKIFQKDFAEAKTAEAKLALAMKLDKQGDASKDDPVERYALWRLAADGTSEAGEFSAAVQIVDKIQGEFDIDGEALKAELLNAGAARATISPEAARNLCETALKLAATAVGREDFDAAARYSKLATNSVRRAKDPQFSREVLARDREIEHLKTRYAAVAAAMETLNSNADDPGANLAIGRWQCFAKGDWEKGLPCLAKGSREDLAALAKQELAKPAAAKDQAALADGWWALAEKDRTDFKAAYRARALRWYEQAVPGLSGLEKIRVEKQVAAAKQSPAGEAAGAGAKSFGARGVLQKGNVALAANGTTIAGTLESPNVMLAENVSPGTATQAKTPCEFSVVFDKVYHLQQVRFLIYEGTTMRYALLASSDGRRFDILEDHRGEITHGWQDIRFAPRGVKAIKFVCAAGASTVMEITQFEAYCYPLSTAAPAKKLR